MRAFVDRVGMSVTPPPLPPRARVLSLRNFAVLSTAVMPSEAALLRDPSPPLNESVRLTRNILLSVAAAASVDTLNGFKSQDYTVFIVHGSGGDAAVARQASQMLGAMPIRDLRVARPQACHPLYCAGVGGRGGGAVR